MVHRVYIDETDVKFFDPITRCDTRAFMLMGLIIEKNYYEDKVVPMVEEFKEQLVASNIIPSINTTFHLYDIKKRTKEWKELNSPNKRKNFWQELLQIITQLNFTLVASYVKLGEFESFSPNQGRSYKNILFKNLCNSVLHYGINNNVKEFRFIHENLNDQAYKDNINGIYNRIKGYGSSYVSEQYARNLFNRAIEFEEKSSNYPGLELVDIAANPILRYNIGQLDEDVPKELKHVFLGKIYDGNELRPREYGLKKIP